MELFTYLMAKKGHNTHRDLFSYLLGKNAGGNGTYTTFSGTSLNISNTLQAKIKNIALEGNTSQKTTTGKNLFDKDNQVKVQVNSEGTLRYGIIVDAPNKKVSISAKNWNNSIAVKQLINGTYGDFLNINSNTTFDVVDKLIIYSTSDTAKLDSNIEELQVEINDAPTDCEPYTGGIASPNPNYPQPIKVVTDEQNINIRSKNLFDYTKHTALALNNKGCITTTNYYIEDNEIIYKLKPNTKYTFSFRNSNMELSNYGLAMSVNGTWVQTNSGKYTVTSDSKGEFAIKIGAQSYPNIGAVSAYIQLEEGTSVTSYTPHQSQAYSISLGNIELAKIGNYKDYIFKNVTGSPYYNDNLELNEWYLHKEIGKAILTEDSWGGVRNVTIDGTSRPIFYSRNDIFKSYNSMASMMCNYFQVKKTYGTSPTANNQFYCNYERTNNLEFAKFDLTTAAEWKEWLSTHNVILMGKRATPTNTKITDTTLIQQLENINNNARSYKDTTIIECTSASTDNETIGFSGDIKVTSVGLGNSLNTSLLSSNIQEETNLDDVNEIEEQNDEPIENEEIIEEEYQEL